MIGGTKYWVMIAAGQIAETLTAGTRMAAATRTIAGMLTAAERPTAAGMPTIVVSVIVGAMPMTVDALASDAKIGGETLTASGVIGGAGIAMICRSVMAGGTTSSALVGQCIAPGDTRGGRIARITGGAILQPCG
jgi:hypothetical protein